MRQNSHSRVSHDHTALTSLSPCTTMAAHSAVASTCAAIIAGDRVAAASWPVCASPWPGSVVNSKKPWKPACAEPNNVAARPNVIGARDSLYAPAAVRRTRMQTARRLDECPPAAVCSTNDSTTVTDASTNARTAHTNLLLGAATRKGYVTRIPTRHGHRYRSRRNLIRTRSFRTMIV